jgi:hypothetical protein
MRNHTPTSTETTGFRSPEQPADSPPQAAGGGSDLLGRVTTSSVIIGVGAISAVLGTLSLVPSRSGALSTAAAGKKKPSLRRKS